MWNILLGLALSFVITSIAHRILKGTIVFLPALIFLVFDFAALDATHHWYSTLAALTAIRVLMSGRGVGRLAAAGFLCGVATLFTQTQGCFSLFAVIIYLLIEESAPHDHGRLKKLVALLMPFTLLCSGVLGYYMYRAGAHTVLFDLFVFPIKYLPSGSFNSPKTYLHQFPNVHGFGDVVRFIPYILIYALVPYIYFYGLYDLWRKRTLLPRVMWQQLFLLNLTGLALFLAISSGPRFFRISTVAPPAILIFVWLLSQQGNAFSIARKVLWAVAAVFALWMPVHRQMQWHGILSLPIGKTAFVSEGQMREFQWFKQRTQPGDRFFNEYLIGLYFLLDNPTRADLVNNDDYTRPEDITSIVQSLHKKHRRNSLCSIRYKNMGGSDVHDHSEPFQRYVQKNYCPIQSFQYDRYSYIQEVWTSCSNSTM